MTKSSARQPKRPIRLLPSLILLLVLLGVVVTWRLRAPHPLFLAQARAAITQPEWHDGSWYWIEGAGAPGSHLMRAGDSGSAPVATVEGIHTYAFGDGKLAWIASDSGKWTITIATVDGSAKQTLRSGDTEPQGLAIAEGRVFWMEPVPALFPESGAFPLLESQLQLVSVPQSGGAPTVITTLMEKRGGQVIGVHSGQVYFSAYRPVTPGATAIYRVPLTGGAPHRLVGETGRQSALLTRDGVLYWSAASRESALFVSTVYIRRLGKDGHPEDLTDWLAGNGRLAESGQGVYYVDGSTSPTAWPLGDRESLPHSVPLPVNYSVLAAGASQLLLRPVGSPDNNFALYRMYLP